MIITISIIMLGTEVICLQGNEGQDGVQDPCELIFLLFILEIKNVYCESYSESLTEKRACATYSLIRFSKNTLVVCRA